MLATITLLGFLKCLGYVFIGITAIALVAGVMIFWMEVIWPKLSPMIPEKVKDYSAIVFVIAVVLLMFFAVFVAAPMTICTSPGGPCS